MVYPVEKFLPASFHVQNLVDYVRDLIYAIN